MGMFAEYQEYDGLGLAELVCTGQVTPLELLETAIAQIEQYNPQVNAVIHKLYDRARQRASGLLPDGAFKGVPFLVKDLGARLAGAPLHNGSRAYRGYIPDHDAELFRRYQAAGVVILGKTNAPEFGLTPYTEPELFGPSCNPWNLERTTGGSSGGSAAAVASGMVPLAHGGDGGGSIRIPSSCCGLFGFKPTRGRTPVGPDYAQLWHGFALEHVLTRSVRDSAAMLDATAGPDIGAMNYPPPPARPFLAEVSSQPGPLRIAFTSRPLMGHTVHDDCLRGLQETVNLLRALGHTLIEDAPEVDGEALSRDFITMLFGEVRGDIEAAAALTGRKPSYKDYEVQTWALGMLSKKTTAGAYSLAVRRLEMAARTIGAFFEKYDVLLTPTVSMPPFKIGALQPTPFELRLLRLVAILDAPWILISAGMVEQLSSRAFDFIPYTPLFNITGQPAMSVPLYWNDEGLPVGMQFVGRFADEATLFRLAGQLEHAQPWFHRRPPLLKA